MSTPEDARLKRIFEDLREDDRRAAPDFMNTVCAGERGAVAARERRSRIFISGTLLLAGVGAMMVVTRLHQPSPPPVRAPRSLLRWSSPTAFLLETPGRQYWSEPPRLGGYRGIDHPGVPGKERK